ncbi:M60 family metallopeptidase [Enterococcus faecalis]|uniref:M60 family metallopeptidase n=1 Tax=Enterococcus faecalis TaxID=1351 RepID=UPI003CC5725A
MKKFFSICLLLFCGVFDNSEVFGEQEEVSVESLPSIKENQEGNIKQITKKIIGRGNAEKERVRQRRAMRYSSLEPVGLYAEQGNILTIDINGQDSLELVVGSPERNIQKKYPLKQGQNVVNVENEGAIYIVNPNEGGSSKVSISGATGNMPYFDLNTTSVEDFQKQMTIEKNVRDVQLVSNKAIITVSYEKAKRYIEDPKELMEYYDKFLVAQDRVSGINNGKIENLVDQHFQHFIEVSRKYMFATQEYMGFNGDGALSRLLKTNNGWGIWHESGHQRQQAPWKWSSVVESTVNIYSMAAQKEITGSINAMDKYYSQMHAYLKSENKNFEKQNNDLKMVMFGQLANTFGENFYPILHQYYRENRLDYKNDVERIQNFMINVSNITGYNMIPYFEQWGFETISSTKEQTNQLLALPKQIWLNDKQVTEKLPMKLIDSVSLSERGVKVDLTKFENDIFQGQKIILLKNNHYLSELTNKIPYNSSLNENVWETYIELAPTDRIQIKVVNYDGSFQLYDSSIFVEQVKSKILDYLNSETSLDELLTQAILDDIRKDIDKITDEKNKTLISTLFEQLEEKYLESLIKSITLDEKGNLFIEFTSAKFKEYSKIVVLGTNKYIAEVANGKAYYSSLSNNILKVSKQENQSNFSIQFRLSHKTYTVSEVNKEELILKNDIENLFTSNNELKKDVTQEKIDNLRTRISLLSGSLKEIFTTRVNSAQQLFFELMISDLEFINNKVSVSFLDEQYKNYKIVVLEDKKYMAEVNNGNPYYGQLNQGLFTTSGKAKSGSVYTVEVRHNSGTYTIKERSFD